MRTCVLVLALCAAAAQAQRGYDAASQRYQEELLRQQLLQRQQQQQQQQQYARQQQQAALMQAQREALMNAQRQAGGGGYPGGDSRPPLSKKEQKALKKKQEKDAKMLKELRKNNDKLRAKAAAQRGRGRSSRRAVGTSRGGLGGFVTSWKGILALGGFAYLFVFQVWVIALKPVVRFVVLRGKGGGELPGGSY